MILSQEARSLYSYFIIMFMSNIFAERTAD